MLSEYFAQSSGKLDTLNQSKYQVYLKTQRVVSGHQFGAHSRPKIGPMSSSSGQRIGNRMPANFSSQPQSAVNIKRIDEQSA